MAYKEQQQQNQELKITLDDVINESKNNGNNNNNNNKIDPYDLLSGFVAYLEEEEDIENPNTLKMRFYWFFSCLNQLLVSPLVVLGIR